MQVETELLELKKNVCEWADSVNEVAKRVNDLAVQDSKTLDVVKMLIEKTDSTCALLAKAILELEDPEGNHCMTIGSRNALLELAKK